MTSSLSGAAAMPTLSGDVGAASEAPEAPGAPAAVDGAGADVAPAEDEDSESGVRTAGRKAGWVALASSFQVD